MENQFKMYRSDEDLAVILEEYFWTYGPDLKVFEESNMIDWDFDEFEKEITMFFEDDYDAKKMFDELSEHHKRFECWDVVDYVIDSNKVTIFAGGGIV